MTPHRVFVCAATLVAIIGGADIAGAAVIGFTATPPGFTGAYGVAWGDAIGDHLPELGYTKDGGEGWVFSGGGVFETSQSGVTSLAWGDYDDDGLLDVASAACLPLFGLCIFHNGGDNSGFFFDKRNELGVGATQCFGVGWADFDRDGDLDLCVARQGGARSTLFENIGGTSFNEVALGVVAIGVAWGDYDNDRWPDLYLPNRAAGTSHLFHNVAGTLVDVTTATLANAGGKGYHAEWVDIDNDGDLDLYVGNTTFGGGTTSRLYRNDNLTAGGFVDVTAASGIVADRATGAWGDYDNDGLVDLYARNTGGYRLWRNLGGGTFTNVTEAPLGGDANGGVAWGDREGDGQLDLAVGDTLGALVVFHNDGHANHWLHVDLVGTTSNRFGIGARIEVLAAGTRYMREVTSNSGYLSGNSITAEFGLAAATTIDSVIVSWPSGIHQAIAPPSVDQRIVITEGATLGVPGDEPARSLLLSSLPNPFTESTRLVYVLPRAGRVRVDVVDLAGRTIRTLVSREDAAGRHECLWDGRTDGGDPVSPGVYLYRLRSGSFDVIRRVVRVL